jgi:hypothetical protein
VWSHLPGLGVCGGYLEIANVEILIPNRELAGENFRKFGKA